MTGFDIILPALMQIPFIAAFIWFAVRLSSDYRKDAKERDQHWMEFLSIERSQRKEAMDQGMDEVKQMTQGMLKLTESMSDLARAIAEHNVSATERYNHIKEIIKRDVK